MKPIKHIVLFTATGQENLGDELITLCEVNQIRKVFGEPNIAIFSHNIACTKRFFLSQKISLNHLTLLEYFPNNYKRHPIRNCLLFFQTLKAVYQSNHIFVGGGGLLYGQNEEGSSPIKLWKMRAILARLCKKKITYLSIGISATRDELHASANTLFRGNTITVRDTRSQEIVEKCGFRSDVLPDPVFTLPIKESLQRVRKVGIAVRSGFIGDAQLLALIKILLHEQYEVILLPHSLHPTDERSHDGYYLQNFLLPGVQVSQSIEQTLLAYQNCSLIIGMRLHSMILAIIHRIPFIALTYGQKTETLCHDLNWKYTYQAHTFQADSIKLILEDIENNRSQRIKQMTQYHQKQQELYNQNFPQL